MLIIGDCLLMGSAGGSAGSESYWVSGQRGQEEEVGKELREDEQGDTWKERDGGRAAVCVWRSRCGWTIKRERLRREFGATGAAN